MVEESTSGSELMEQSDPWLIGEGIEGRTEMMGGSLRFIKRKGTYVAHKQMMLKNSLLTGVGFLELANAGDFAANVFNQIPPTTYAIILMAIGGTAALGILYYVVSDGLLSLANYRGLRQEREFLKGQRADCCRDRQLLEAIDTFLAVNYRELGTEIVDRICMDSFMGFGALMVGAGTYMAISGANHKVWLASNLMSGYIGNAPCAMYGIANFVWSIFVWRRARRHGFSTSHHLEINSDVAKMLKSRTSSVKFHALLNAITGIVGGGASLATATHWEGYPVLLPCIISSILLNYLWRHHLGYDRPFIRQLPLIDGESLSFELKAIFMMQQVLNEKQQEPSSYLLSKLLPNSLSVTVVVDFLIKYQLFEDFCITLLENKHLSTAILGEVNDSVTVDLQKLLKIDPSYTEQILGIAEECIAKNAQLCFKYRERYLLETLGCYLCIHNGEDTADERLQNTYCDENSIQSINLQRSDMTSRLGSISLGNCNEFIESEGNTYEVDDICRSSKDVCKVIEKSTENQREKVNPSVVSNRKQPTMNEKLLEKR